jgi:hypothetical protein
LFKLAQFFLARISLGMACRISQNDGGHLIRRSLMFRKRFNGLLHCENSRFLDFVVPD